MSSVIDHALCLGIPYLTFYCLSVENQSRSQAEITHIMDLAMEFASQKTEEFSQKKVCFRVIGERSGMPRRVRRAIEALEELTREAGALHVTCAVNYGGRQEIVSAVSRMLDEQRRYRSSGLRPSWSSADVETMLARHLETAVLPDVDLIIRTSGEKRLSNFLLWQAAYSELAFTDVLWPDFTPAVFEQALRDYAARERRFGGRPSTAAAAADLVADGFRK